MKKYFSIAILLFVFFGPFFLYLYHLAPSYIPIDSAEFTMCMEYWGLCHPPGFPLYVAVGHFFVQFFPFGEVIWRANLLSAIFGALTISTVYGILIRLGVRRELSILGVLVLSVSTSFWEFSLSADVFTFGTFLVSLSLLFAFWGRRNLSLFVLGLSGSHFYLTAVIWPIYVWYFWKDSKRRFIDIIYWGAIFSTGFFPQAIMYLRMQQNPEINWGHGQGIGGFIDYARRKEFGSGFLLSNPALIYSPLKNLKQIAQFLKTWLFEFGLILPFFAFASIFFAGIKKRREVILIFGAFCVFSFVQLFLLSTIDPSGADNPFQLNKFYLVSFVLGTLLSVILLDYLIRRYLSEFLGVFVLLLSALTFIYLLVNWQTITMRNNYFSNNLVLDALDELPSGAIAITVDHVIYFGGLYEQKVNGVHADKTILYFPNEKNKDNEYYHPEIFEGEENSEFMGEIESEYKLGAAERYVLSVISKNLDRDIYIMQGEFEYNFFRYLNEATEPWGLWVRVKKDGREAKKDEILALFADNRNQQFKKDQFFLKQQGFEAGIYAIAYYQSALTLATVGEYEHALSFFEKSLVIDPTKTNIQNDIALVKRVLELSKKTQELYEGRGSELLEFSEGLATIKNYRESVRGYEELLRRENPDARVYNGAASVYAALGDREKARTLWEEALAKDPNLDSARIGLDSLK